MARITVQDRSDAQHLPDEFLELSGDSKTRIVELVTRYWDAYDADKRAQLGEALFPILERVMQPGTQITDETRDLCEGLVAAWIFRQP
jgi:hypothetical protein